MKGILAVANTTTTTTSTATTPVCQVYAAGNYVGNCTALSRYFAPPGWYTSLLYVLLGVAVIFISLFAVRLYYEYPYGRKMWKNNNAWGIIPLSWGGVLAKMIPLTTKGYWADGGKDFQGFIAAVPGAAVHLTQKLGGVTFMLVNPDIGACVSPALTEWGNRVLGKKVRASSYMMFLVDWMEGVVKQSQSRPKPLRFPPLESLAEGAVIYVPSKDNLTLVTKKASELTANDIEYWREEATKEKQQLEAASVAENEALVRINCIRTGASNYEFGGKTKPFGDLEKTEFFESVSAQLASLPHDSPLYPEWFGGRLVDAAEAAKMINSMPDSKFGKEYRADIEELQRRKTKESRANDMRLLIGAGLFVVCVAFALVVLRSQGFLGPT